MNNRPLLTILLLMAVCYGAYWVWGKQNGRPISHIAEGLRDFSQGAERFADDAATKIGEKKLPEKVEDSMKALKEKAKITADNMKKDVDEAKDKKP